MKKVIWICSLFVFIIATKACYTEDTPKNESTQSQQDIQRQGGKMSKEAPTQIEEFLGEKMLTILLSPDTIESYQIESKKNKSKPNLLGYPIIRKGKNLSKVQIQQLQTLFLDPNTYLFDTVKKCPFLPEYAFVVKRHGQSMHVLIDYSCEVMKFFFEHQKLLEDFDPVTSKFVQLTDAIFQNPSEKQDSSKIISTPATIEEFLGQEIISIISEPDQIDSYKIASQKDETQKNIYGYPIIEQGPKLSQEQITLLQSFLLDHKTYLFETVKKCLFLPEYAFTFKKGDKMLAVLICYSCEDLKFIYASQQIREDFDPVTPKMQQLTDAVFFQNK